MKPKGRNKHPHTQFSCLGLLLSLLAAESSTVLLSLFIFPALAVSACQVLVPEVKAEEEEGAAAEPAAAPIPLTYSTNCQIDSITINNLDIFVYGNSGLMELQAHKSIKDKSIKAEDSLTIEAPESKTGHTVVIIANCPKQISEMAVSRLESMELLEFPFEEDSPQHPILSGRAVAMPGASAQVELTPLLARVVLTSVTNGLRNYVLLEDPTVRLCTLTPSARVLQMEEFRPSETIARGASQALPCDVGFYTQYPNVVLYCYPNDTPQTTLAAPRTSLEFFCKIKGLECTIPVELPAIKRNSTTKVEITVNDLNDYESSFQ